MAEKTRIGLYLMMLCTMAASFKSCYHSMNVHSIVKETNKRVEVIYNELPEESKPVFYIKNVRQGPEVDEFTVVGQDTVYHKIDGEPLPTVTVPPGGIR